MRQKINFLCYGGKGEKVMANDNKKEVTKKEITKKEIIMYINSKLNLQLTHSNTTCKNLWEEKNQWWLEIDNSKFQIDYHLLLVDMIDRCIHYFKIPANKITEPEKKFAQILKKNKNEKKCKSSILLIKNNTLDFEDHYNENHFSFKSFYIEGVPFSKSDLDQEQHQDKNKHQQSKTKTSRTKKTYKPNPDNIQSDKVLKLVSHIRSLINKINEYRENNGKHPIFIDNKLSPLWTDIEEPCTSEDKKEFVYFILNLYKLIYEATRTKTKRSKKEERNFYTFLLPDKFLEKGTETREFIDIVGSLRHGYAHKSPEYKVPIKKMTYADILEKLLRNKNKEENYSIMQIELLKRFEEAMKKLLEIVKNEQNLSQKP